MTDVWTDLLEGGEGAALGFDLADDVLSDCSAEVGGGAGEPFAFLYEEVAGDALGLLLEVGFVAAGFVERGDCLVDFVALDAAAGFESVGGAEL